MLFIMLVKFSVCNYKTFREKAELTLIASNYDKETLPQNLIEVPKFGIRLLKSAVVYGANASGKSKLIDAMRFMGQFIRNSSKETQTGEAIPVEPFRLSTETEHEPTEMEIVFIEDDVLYRYGFEVSQQTVVAEWLFYRPNTKEVELFYRDADGTQTHPRLFGGIVNQLIKNQGVRDNALLLSVAAQFNHKLAKQVVNWFGSTFRIISGLQEEGYHPYTLGQAGDPAQKEKILTLLQQADLDIIDFSVSNVDVDNLPTDMPDSVKELIRKQVREHKAVFFDDVKTAHKKYNELRLSVGHETFSMEEDESSGTRKFFALTGPILDVLANGYTLIVDELDAKLHPSLSDRLIQLFHSPALNPKNAQLIFNTHNTNLLSAKTFRREQIWFTEKDRYGAVTLYSLGSFRTDTVRKSDDYERKYLEGRYGGIPYLGGFDRMLEHPTELIHAN